MPSEEIPGDSGERRYLIATDGYRVEVVDEIPEWATLHWWLHDDPRGRADWSRLNGYHPEKFNKLSKSDVEVDSEEPVL